MKALQRLLIVALIMSPITASLAAPKTLADFKSIYDAELLKIADAHMADMASLQKAYSDYLETASKKATDAGDFKTYEKAEQEKQRFAKERTIPADSPLQKLVPRIEAKRNAAIHNLSSRYSSGLKAHQVSLMKAKNIEGARMVQQEIEKVNALIAEYASKLAASPKPEAKAAGSKASSGKLTLNKPAAITVNWHKTDFLVGNSAYTNYKYLLTEMPKELDGYLFIQQVKRKEIAVEFEVTDSGIAYCFHTGAPDDEWKDTGWTVGINYNGKVVKFSVYKKTLNKGIYSLPKRAWLIFPKK